MTSRRLTFFLSLFMLGASHLSAQEQYVRIVSYNVENFFDTTDDPETDDDDFLPDGELRWTKGRFHNKVNRISWVISTLGGWQYPDIVALVEVENEEVVRKLVQSQSLRKAGYKYLVSDGADPRGIDVALLWRSDCLRLKKAHEIPQYGQLMFYPHGKDKRSKSDRAGTGRNTLWVTLEVRGTGELLELFVVHAPSRRGGARSTQEKRMTVMAKIRQVVDRLFQQNAKAKILLLGDFNDNPNNRSVEQVLGAIPLQRAKGQYRKDQLYNLAAPLFAKGRGSHYFSGNFWMPDQIIVSGTLLQCGAPLQLQAPGMQIYAPDDIQDNGRPLRTYKGTHHAGGYSDHFPIYADFISQTPCKE